MKRMPVILVLAVGWLAAVAVRITPPTEVVRNLIVGAKANDLNVVLHSVDFLRTTLGRHGRSAEDLIAFVRAIELAGAEFLGTSEVSSPPPLKDHVILRTPTYELRFHLELSTAHFVKQEGLFVPRSFPVEPHYVVTEVRPGD